MKRLIYYTLFLLFLPSAVHAQNDNDYEVLKQRAKEKVAMLNDYISYMADPQKEQKTRFGYKSEAQKLFINDCNPHKEIIEYKDGSKKEILREGVTMEVVSIRNQTPRPKPMKEYFRGLISMTYKSVVIKTTDIADMRVSKLQPYQRDENGNMTYVCSVYFDQLFIGQRRDGGIYKDMTRKWVVCYVQVDEVIEENGETRSEYMVRLGDIHVESIQKVI